jgi:hypothetical protein
LDNIKFPGRPNYTGPKSGYFAFVHHGVLFEKSHDIFERLTYVDNKKPANEIDVRRWNMMYLDPVLCPTVAKRATLYADYAAKRALLCADYEAKRATLYADYLAKCDTLDADYWAKRDTLDADILAYIRSEIPDCAWDEKLQSLVFPTGE